MLNNRIIFLLFISLSLLFVSSYVAYPDDRNASEHLELGKRLLEQHGVDSMGSTREGFEQGITEIKKAIELNPTSEAYVILGNAYWEKSFIYADTKNEEKKLREAAVQEYKESIRLDPRNPDAYYQLGKTTTDPKLTIDYYRKTIELDPERAVAYWGLAIMYEHQSKIEDAIKEYHNLLRLKPWEEYSGINPYFRLADLYRRSARLDEAMEVYKKYLDIEFDKGQRCRWFHDFNAVPYEKDQDFTRLISRVKTSCNWEHYLRASALWREGNPQEAVEELKLQIKVNPYYEAAYFLLADIYVNQGLSKKAIGVIKESLAIQTSIAGQCFVYKRYRVESYQKLDPAFVESLKVLCEEK